MSRIDGVSENGNPEHRLPHVTNLSFAGVDGEQLLSGLARELAVSSGSACTSASMEPSYVLRAIGVPGELAYASVRFSLGKINDAQQIDFAIERAVETVNRLRQRAAVA
jgi:cysteine desulfurase